MNLDDPAAVASALRARGLEVHVAKTVIGTDERLAEIFTAARRGGWRAYTGRAPRPRHINLGRFLGSLEGP